MGAGGEEGQGPSGEEGQARAGRWGRVRGRGGRGGLGGPAFPQAQAHGRLFRFQASCVQYRLVVRDVNSLQILRLYTCLDQIQHVEWSADSLFILCAMYKRGLVQVGARAAPCVRGGKPGRLPRGCRRPLPFRSGAEAVQWEPASFSIVRVLSQCKCFQSENILRCSQSVTEYDSVRRVADLGVAAWTARVWGALCVRLQAWSLTNGALGMAKGMDLLKLQPSEVGKKAGCPRPWRAPSWRESLTALPSLAAAAGNRLFVSSITAPTSLRPWVSLCCESRCGLWNSPNGTAK